MFTYSALKHTHEKVGDHWEQKNDKGPSDERARNPRARQNEGATAGGVDVAGHTRKELYERARELDISGRSSMTKHEPGPGHRTAGLSVPAGLRPLRS